MENFLKCLEDFYKSNSIDASLGLEDDHGYFIIWPLSDVAEKNDEMNELQKKDNLYMNFDNCLFIGDCGNGDLYFLRYIGGSIIGNDVYKWRHEMDERVWFANNLEILVKKHSVN